MNNHVLFYPSIEFHDFAWLWRASLLYDRIYRIVPRNYHLDEPRNIKELCETGEIGAPIYPDAYAAEIGRAFMEKIESKTWTAAAVSSCAGDQDYSLLHQDKCDEALRRMIIARRGASSVDGFLPVSRQFAATYMTYLARNIAEKNKLEVTTDSLHAWTAAAYFRHDGQMETWKVAANVQPYGQMGLHGAPFEVDLAAIVLSDFLPAQILRLRPKDILAFRSKFRDERNKFIEAIKKAAQQIAQCTDQRIVEDLITDLKKDVDSKTKELRKALSFLNVKAFCGIVALSLPIASALVSTLEKLDPQLSQFLTLTGVAVGGYVVVKEALQKRANLSKESDYSYLLHAKAKFRDTFTHEIYHSFDQFIED